MYPDESSGKQDFKRNGPTRVTFDPSSTNEEREIEIPLVDDEINEADEGFVLVIEMEDNGDRESVGEEIKLVRAGVALIRVADDDRTFCIYRYPYTLFVKHVCLLGYYQ